MTPRASVTRLCITVASAFAFVLPLVSCGSPTSGIAVTEFESLAITAGSGGTSCAPGITLSRGLLYTGGLWTPLAEENPPFPYECCGYLAGIQVTNSLPTQSDSNTPPLAVDEHDVILTTQTTTSMFIPASGSSFALASETIPVNSILPSGGTTASFVTPLLGIDNGKKLLGKTGELIITVTFSGHTRDYNSTPAPGTTTPATNISTEPITFPIDVFAIPALECSSGTVPTGIATCDPTSESQPDGYQCGA